MHKAHAIAKAMFSLDSHIDFFASGLIKAALSLRCGQMSNLRKTLRAIVASKLRVYHGEQPISFLLGDPERHRAFVLDTFFSSVSCTNADRCAVAMMLNGDWLNTTELQHWCHGPTCCESRQHSIAKVTHALIQCLASRAPPIFPRHKWLGADLSIDYFGRMHCIHGLLSMIIEQMFGPETRVPWPWPSKSNFCYPKLS